MDGGVDVVLGGDGVAREEVDGLGGTDAGRAHQLEDVVGRVGRERDEPVGRRDGVVRAARKELEAGTAAAVADANCAGELDEVTEGDVVLEREGALRLDDVINTAIGVCRSSSNAVA